MTEVPLEYLLSFVEEDAPSGDITTDAIIPPDTCCTAMIIAKEEGIICGLFEAGRLFTHFGIEVTQTYRDGCPVKRGEVILSLKGNAPRILLLERTTLNIIGRMSGIATKTKSCMDQLRSVGSTCRVAATRKTSPGMRILDKKAVMLGGGDPHRYSLSDGVLIKDNHLALVPLTGAIASARARSFYRKIEVEVEDPDSAVVAAEAGADIIMLDNMTPEMVVHTLKELNSRNLRSGRVIEVSGTISEDSIRNYAVPGVDVISIGALTHSVRNFDVSLEIRSPGSQVTE
jgi:nicotinate-nucleotide pyrophosphorylase (carboxylating)